MDINVSFTISEAIESKIEFSEEFIDRVLNQIVSNIFRNLKVEAELKDRKFFDNNYEEVIIGLYICDDGEIQALNSEYRGVDVPTDVLSFAMTEGDAMLDLPVLHLGEIIISVDRMVEQAEQNNNTKLQEFIYLVTHGILHLLGLHHDTDSKYIDIVNIQNEVVKNIVERMG